jgi:hypothetical protein
VSKGFVVFAQNTEATDYIKQAYALALSIKNTQSNVTNISVITNDIVPEQYCNVFDQIIPIPWGDLSKNPLWKIENRWKVYHASPYDETIVLDTEMLFLEDISNWWDYCSTSDLKFCSKIKNFKGEIVTRDLHHRKAFINNGLSNPYVALMYFKKSDLAHDFYKVLEFVCKNWEYCYKKYAPNNFQNWLSIDLASAIAIDIMGTEEQVIDPTLPFEFVHMKPAIQNIIPVPINWQDILSINYQQNKLFIANQKQRYLFHYVKKDFLTDNIIKILEDCANGRS